MTHIGRNEVASGKAGAFIDFGSSDTMQLHKLRGLQECIRFRKKVGQKIGELYVDDSTGPGRGVDRVKNLGMRSKPTAR